MFACHTVFIGALGLDGADVASLQASERVRIVSTDFQRTVISAAAVTTGMFTRKYIQTAAVSKYVVHTFVVSNSLLLHAPRVQTSCKHGSLSRPARAGICHDDARLAYAHNITIMHLFAM